MIVLGRIVAPFGVQGWIKIHPFGDDPASWRKMSHWWLCSDDDAPAEAWKQYTLTACRAHGKGLVAALAEVADRGAAEAVDGFYIGAPREALPKPAEGEYYWGDLVGLAVENEAGEAFGTVPLTGTQWLVCVALASAVLWVTELRKLFLRSADRRPARA